MEIKRDPNFRWPAKMRTPPQLRDNQKYCKYHVDHGHTTDECVSLRLEIEKFIKSGRLVRFLAKERQREKIP